MLLIAHRGNINGPNKEKENNPDYIKIALEEGYHVEIDVWYINDEWLLGHDNPQYKINFEFLRNCKFWCHAKNIQALNEMLKYKDIHCFWHQEDDFTITSNRYIWTYPNKQLTSNSVCVMPERSNYQEIDLKKCVGICTDYIYRYKNLCNNK